jgi:sarcosine oxidase, subunit alpha
MAGTRLSGGGLIDRAQPLVFQWNGRRLTGFQGDTLASALLANGVHLVGRSFKYHRPRGIVTAGADEPNAIVQVGQGAFTIPNMRATQVELYDGLIAHSVNCWPSVEFDLGAVTGRLARLLPAGFYYKTFKWPAAFWRGYEHFVRRAAGLGVAPTEPDPDQYDHMHAHCDLLVVGAGPAGLSAALAAGESGQRVVVVEEQSNAGGAALNGDTIQGLQAVTWVAQIIERLAGLSNVRLLMRTTALGLYRDRFAVALERRFDHLPLGSYDGSRQRLWRIRAQNTLLATGALERPLVFSNNDRPGVMLASAASTYLHRFAVCPADRAIVFTNNDSAYETALHLHDAGVHVGPLVDVREVVTSALSDAVKARGIEVLTGHAVVEASGGTHLHGVKLMARRGADVAGPIRFERCDLLAVSGGWNPAVHLHSHLGGKLCFDDVLHTFVPAGPIDGVCSIGAAAGCFALSQCLSDGASAGMGRPLGNRHSTQKEETEAETGRQGTPLEPLWLVPGPRPSEEAPKQFVDFQNDTSAADLALAVREGYRSIEHVKRYTALGFGTDQGKLGNINGLGIVAQVLAVSPSDVGTTTFRPPYSPVTFGAVAGRHIGEFLDPVRKTAMHGWHEERGALFENVGQWHRPWYYPLRGESMHDAVVRESLAVRSAVGIMDASTLGKIDVRGPDAAQFLDRIYTNGWKKLPIGRARYGLMLGEDGMVMDDGVSARLAEDRYYMTTTTGGAAHVLGWMERWRQTEWPELKVYFTSTTDQWATIAIAGPNARSVLSAVCSDIDLSADDFPFMSFKEGVVAEIPARVFRVSFSGELAFEVNVPADYGRAVWESLFAAGKAHGITPYGTETMHVLRAEKGFVIVGQDTDGSVTPGDLGMDWIVAKHKDFIGRRSLSRSDCLRPDRKQLVGLLTEDANTVLPEGAQLVAEPFTRLPVPMIGHVSSSYFSPTLSRSIALALVKGGHGRHGERIYAPLADGRLVAAIIGPSVFYDPKGVRQHG